MALATIRYIDKVLPIEGADRIEIATLQGLGWECVIKKGSFFPGDPCIYVEIDSLLPLNLISGKPEDIDKKHRLRTVKMKGRYSQGLILPLSVLPPELIVDLSDGTDVTVPMHIEKYEKQIPPQLQGYAAGDFPTHIVPKTDEVRIQAQPQLLELLNGKLGYITKKMDGTSATYIHTKDGEFFVCSRNMALKDGDSIYWRIARKYDIQNILPKGYAIQGEICGPGIQKNTAGLEDFELFVFNVYDIDDKCKKLGWFQMNLFLRKIGNLKRVPSMGMFFVDRLIVGVPDSDDLVATPFHLSIENLVGIAIGASYANGNPAEGIVVRAEDQSVSFKVINPAYDMKD